MTALPCPRCRAEGALRASPRRSRGPGGNCSSPALNHRPAPGTVPSWGPMCPLPDPSSVVAAAGTHTHIRRHEMLCGHCSLKLRFAVGEPRRLKARSRGHACPGGTLCVSHNRGNRSRTSGTPLTRGPRNSLLGGGARPGHLMCIGHPRWQEHPACELSPVGKKLSLAENHFSKSGCF